MPQSQKGPQMSQQGLDVVVSFDRTGSMFPCAAELRRGLTTFGAKMSGVPGLRLGVIDHGDYCDRPIIESSPLTANFNDFARELRRLSPCGGGGAGASYAQALCAARKMNWLAAKSRVLVLVGDENPRPGNMYTGEYAVEWQNELRLLTAMGVKVFAVQCLNNGYADQFYSAVARESGGMHLQLHQLANLPLLLTGVVLLQESPEALNAYERQLRTEMPFTRNVATVFDTMAGRKVRTVIAGGNLTAGLTPVDPGRFQRFRVEQEIGIRDFVREMGITFEKGRGFYPHISRTERVQSYKEIILEDLATGDLFTGDEVRDVLNIPHGVDVDVRKDDMPTGYRVWIQSTSVNRKLREPYFMYEVTKKASSPSSAPAKKPAKPGRKVTSFGKA